MTREHFLRDEQEFERWFRNHHPRYIVFEKTATYLKPIEPVTAMTKDGVSPGKSVSSTIEERIKIERLVWTAPDTYVFRIYYLCEPGTLYVSGDLGEAVYRWSDRVDLAWIAGCNLDYFASKCQASEKGRQSEDWCEKKAEQYVRDYFKEHPEGKTLEQFEEENGHFALCHKGEWIEWLRDNGNEFFGDDWWEFASEFGNRTSIRCHSHLYGLKMAMEKLGVKIR